MGSTPFTASTAVSRRILLRAALYGGSPSRWSSPWITTSAGTPGSRCGA